MRIILLLTSLFSLSGRGDDAAALWSTQVQPLLDVHCVKCHGPIERRSGLELDSPEAVLRGGNSGAVVEPGRPEESPLFRYLAPESDPHMPPKKQLTDEQRETVRRWIVALDGSMERTGRPSRKAGMRFGSVTEAIDGWIAAGWKERGVKPAAAVDDRTWCRRVYLDLAGRIPTSSELEEFMSSRAREKRSGLVDRLLASPEYAVRMREAWDVLLMGRPRRENHEDRRRQNGWWAFLEGAFGRNQPWNETVRAMLVARPGSPAENGASWFLYERRNDHQAIAEAVAPVVYGTKIDCAQCHDHPLAREIRQAHYWGLVAAFNRSKNVEGTAAVAESAVGGFVNFTNLRKESQPAVITLLNGRTIDEARPAGETKETERDDQYVDPQAKVRVPKFSRRAAFADAVTRDNPLLARAFVNRMWALLFGRGLVHPADAMTARNVPSHPELLDWLAQDFAAHGYDVRRLVRGMVLSRLYGLGPSAAPPEAFAGASERPLSAEQLARSWRVAAGLPPDEDKLRRQVIAAMPEVLPVAYQATFQQAQFLATSRGLAEILQPGAGGTVGRLASMREPKQKVREAFMAVYGRAPDRVERREAVAFLEGYAGSAEEAVRELLWALMTSAEFLTLP